MAPPVFLVLIIDSTRVLVITVTMAPDVNTRRVGDTHTHTHNTHTHTQTERERERERSTLIGRS